MPNITVRAAATGLPSFPPPPLREIMLQAHDYAAAMPARLAYVDRFREALRRSWRDMKAEVIRRLRVIVEDRVERLIAFLDHLDGDTDLEPSLAGSRTSDALDAEESCEDEGGQCDDEGHDSDSELSMGWTEVHEEGIQSSRQACLPMEEDNAFFPEVFRCLDDERAATSATCERFAEIIARLSGMPAGLAVCQ